MSYRFATSRHDYSDLASARVFRSAPGYPAFPVRLAQEMFERAASHLPQARPLSIWDPCCGSGYLASVVSVLNRPRVRSLLCSDIDPGAVEIASRNLLLLTANGLRDRQTELLARADEYGKPQYADAAHAAQRLAQILRNGGGDLSAAAHVADALDPRQLMSILPDPPPDLVLTDAPYGNQTSWRGHLPAAGDPLTALVHTLCQVLPEHAIIALTALARKLHLGIRSHPLERFRVGKRAGLIGRVADLGEAE